MEFEHAIETINEAVLAAWGRPLNDAETDLLRGVWHGQTYDQIAKACGYSASYLRCDVGNKLWKRLSKALGEPVSKFSFRTVVEHWNGAVGQNRVEGEGSGGNEAERTKRGDEAINLNSLPEVATGLTILSGTPNKTIYG